MSSVLAVVFMVLSAFMFYSPKVEQNRIVTITKPITINQERRTPAYYLYQQAQLHQTKEAPSAVTTYLSAQNFEPNKIEQIAVNEMKVDRHEIASTVDAGFSRKNNEQYLKQATSVIENQKEILSTTSGASGSFVANTAASLQIPAQQQSVASSGKKWATVKGKFETRGVGIIDQIIELKRIEEGQVRELGRIDLNAGTYSIDIESPQGILVAEIRDKKNGIIIGEDRQKIINLQSKGLYFEGPFIQVKNPQAMAARPEIPNKPSDTRNGGSAIRASGHIAKGPEFQTSLFSNQNILEKPTDEFTNISRNSSSLAILTEKNQTYRRVLTVRHTGDDSSTPLFSEKWIDGVVQYVSDQQQIQFKSEKTPVLIGRILIDGKPASGIQVQIENYPSLIPIYLDQFMIPSFKIGETTENGYFMFVGLEANTYSVTAFKNNKILGTELFVAEDNAVSYQNISSLSVPTSVVLRTFDAFNSDPIDADVSTPDIEEIIQTISGSISYRKQSSLGVAKYHARTNNPAYLPVNYFTDSRKEFVHIPMIQEQWLNQLQSSRLINLLPETGIYVGFVPELEYEVYLVSEGFSRDNIVYFDIQGRISPIPVKGGGFVIFNVPTKAHEVIVQDSSSERVYSQVFDLKPEQVNISHFND